MTAARTPWRVVERRSGWDVYENDRLIAEFDDPEDAALAVSAVNASGGEPVYWQVRGKLASGAMSKWLPAGDTEPPPHFEEQETRPLYAAPITPRPEPAGEVEQRVSDEAMRIMLFDGMDAEELRAALNDVIHDCLAARTALARRPEQWRDIASAAEDPTIEIWVYAPPREGLPAIQCKCAWHPDAGFCVDELRHVTHWMPLAEALPPAPPAEDAEGGTT